MVKVNTAVHKYNTAYAHIDLQLDLLRILVAAHELSHRRNHRTQAVDAEKQEEEV